MQYFSQFSFSQYRHTVNSFDQEMETQQALFVFLPISVTDAVFHHLVSNSRAEIILL